jgi:hypothetical protein
MVPLGSRAKAWPLCVVLVQEPIFERVTYEHEVSGAFMIPFFAWALKHWVLCLLCGLHELVIESNLLTMVMLGAPVKA